MQQLVQQMRHLATNQNDQPFEKVNLIQIAKKTSKTFQDAYKRKVHFETLEEPLFVNGNKAQLQQVLYILIDNAMKYSEMEIKIEISKQTKVAQINVIDFGEGIPESDQEYIV